MANWEAIDQTASQHIILQFADFAASAKGFRARDVAAAKRRLRQQRAPRQQVAFYPDDWFPRVDVRRADSRARKMINFHRHSIRQVGRPLLHAARMPGRLGSAAQPRRLSRLAGRRASRGLVRLDWIRTIALAAGRKAFVDGSKVG